MFSRKKFEADMSDELKFHIEQFTEDLVQSGVPREEAERRARVEFGGTLSVKDECREARGLYWFDELSRQLRYAVRLLRKSPGFTVTALATLAICLGANLAIFAVIDSVLLRSLPFPEPGQLVTIYNSYPKANVDRDGASLTNYYERRGQIGAFRSLSIIRGETSLIGEPGSTERVAGARVSPEFFDTLGVRPSVGRVFTEGETTYQTDHVVMLTHDFWKAHAYQVGQPMRVEGLRYTVIGILPPGFGFLSSPAQLYFPYASRPQDRVPRNRHNGNSITMVARMKPGVTIAEAKAQVDAQDAALAPSYPQAAMIAETGFHSVIASLHEDHVASVRPTLLMLQCGALLLLIIGVVNLVNLLLVRANGRMKELAVRQALGASNRHVVSEVLVETTLLTLVGGALGCGVAALGIRLLETLGADQLPLGANIAFDGRVALAALAVAVVSGIAMALPIAWFSLRNSSLHTESRTGTANATVQTMRHGFIVAQMALAFVLLAGAGLLGLSLKNLLAVSPGFHQDHILTGQVSLPWAKYPGGSVARYGFVAELARTLGQQPGVLAAGIGSNVPFSGRLGKSAATAKGYRPKAGEPIRGVYSYGVGGDYFQALGIPLRAGRFLVADEPQAVCVVDEDFARQYWPAGSAVGQSLYMGTDTSPKAILYRVVGVVGRVKQAGLADDVAQGAVYYPYVFREDSDLTIVARTGVAPESMALTLQRAVRSLDRDLPVTGVRTMVTMIEESLLTRRSPALLAGLFSAIALLLTAIGTYGVLSYAVTQRRREIAVRMALGARPDQIRGQFFGVALRLLVLGLGVGLVGAWLMGQAMQAVLFQVPALHWVTLGLTAAVMGVVCFLACVLPAYRAARTPPMEALAE